MKDQFANYAEAFVKATAGVDSSALPVGLDYENIPDSITYCGLKDSLRPRKFFGTAEQLSSHILAVLNEINQTSFGFSDWEIDGIASMLRAFLDEKHNRGYPAHICSHRYGKSAERILDEVQEPARPSFSIKHFRFRGEVARITAGSRIAGFGAPSITLQLLPSLLPWQEPRDGNSEDGLVRYQRRIVGTGPNGAKFIRYIEEMALMGISSEYSSHLFKRSFPVGKELEVTEGISAVHSLRCTVVHPITRRFGIVPDATEHSLWLFFYPSTGRLGKISTFSSTLNSALSAHVEETWLADLREVQDATKRTLIPMQ